MPTTRSKPAKPATNQRVASRRLGTTPLSSYWRVVRHATLESDMLQALNTCRAVAYAMGLTGEVKLSWSDKSATNSNGSIILDAGPLKGTYIPSDAQYDVVLGTAYHEIGHNLEHTDTCHLSAVKGLSVINQKYKLDYEWFNIIEDWWVDTHMEKVNPLAAEYIQRARDYHRGDPNAQDTVNAILSGELPKDVLKHAIKQLMLSTLVYREPIPANTPPAIKKLLTSLTKAGHESPEKRGYRYAEMYKQYRTLVDEIDQETAADGGASSDSDSEDTDEGQGSSGKGSSGAKSDSGQDDSKGKGKSENAKPQQDKSEDKSDGGAADDADDGDDEDEGAGGGADGDQDSDSEGAADGTSSRSADSKSRSSSNKATQPAGGDEESRGITQKEADNYGLPATPATLEELKQAVSAALAEAVAALDRGDVEDATKTVTDLLGKGASGTGAAVSILNNLPTGQHHVLQQASMDAEPYRQRLSRMFDMVRAQGTRMFRGEESGHISPSRLYRAGFSDRIFEHKEAAVDKGLGIVLLLDASSSVSDAWKPIMLPLASAISRLGRDHQVVVLNYTSAYENRGQVAKIGVMYQRGYNELRGVTPDMNGTPSGPAMAVALSYAKRLRKPRKLILHVTDGEPGSYNNINGLDAVRTVTQAIRDAKVGHATVLVTDGMSASQQERIAKAYGSIAYAKDMADVPDAIQTLLREALR